jgi:Putative addiction module component
MATTREILAELLQLPARQRARLAAELIRSLDQAEDPDTAEAWVKELHRRVGEITGGTAKLEDWSRVQRKIELRLRSR